MIPVVVAVQPLLDSLVELAAVVGRVQKDVLILNRAPEALDVDVIQGPALAVHADSNTLFPQVGNVLRAGKLASLVGVQDLRCTVLGHGLADHPQAGFRRQGVGQSPAHDVPRVHVDDGRQVHEALLHRHVGDIDGPDLPRSVDLQLTQQVGVNVLRLPQDRQVPAWVNGSDTGFAHQSTHPLVAGSMALIPQHGLHGQHARGRLLQDMGVHEPHHGQVLRVLALGLVVNATPAYPEEPALPPYR